jgi:hypothetical protein
VRVFLVLAVLALAAAVRFHQVGHDLPLDLEPTNAPALDAFWYLEAAQGSADGSHVDPVVAYDRPVWIALARGWFALRGTGIESSHELSALLGVVGVLGVALALRASRAGLLGALLLATSYPFAGLARTPLVYTPLGALLVLVFALHTSERPMARLAAWALLLGLAWGFKGVALVLAPGLALSDLARASRWRALAVAGVAIALALAALAAIDPELVSWNLERLHRYGAQGLTPGQAAVRLVLAPELGRLVELAPGLAGLAAVGATRWRRPLVLGAIGWAATVVFGLSLLEWRESATVAVHPLRFYALAGPPLAILAGTGLDALLSKTPGRRAAPIAAGLVAASVFAHFARSYVAAAAAPVGLGAALLVGLVPLPALHVAPRRLLAVVVLVLVLVLDLQRDLVETPTSLKDANLAARRALGDNAVLAGPYSSCLAAGSRLERRRAPRLFGGPHAREGIALARSEGFTHVALDRDQDLTAGFAEGFAREGEPLSLVLTLRIRDEVVLVYRFHGAGTR